MSFSQAREKREAARKEPATGKRPALEKKRAAVAARSAQENTFAKVAEELIAKWERKGRERKGMAPTTAGKLRWYLSLLGKLGERPIGEIEAFEILEPLRNIEASGLATRREFWQAKIEVNRARYLGDLTELAAAGWRALMVWECALKGPVRLPVDAMLARVKAWLDTEEPAGVVHGMPNPGVSDLRQGSI